MKFPHSNRMSIKLLKLVSIETLNPESNAHPQHVHSTCKCRRNGYVVGVNEA